MDLISILIGAFGIGLIVNAIAIITSSRYFSFFRKTYFIEPASDVEKDRITRGLQNEEQNAQRYGLSIISIVLGLVAILWSVKTLKSIPFFSLAAIAFILAIAFKLFNKRK